MKILIVGINYAPEIVGIGPYTTGMAQFLAEAMNEVTVVCAQPYYPEWKVHPQYSRWRSTVSVENGVRVVRVPTYVPSNPSGPRRLIHHASFAVSAGLSLISEVRRCKPDVVIAIAPSLISIVAARSVAYKTRAKLWLHIQDFEVEAAFATGLLKDSGVVADLARRFEAWAVNADRVSTISPQMCKKLIEKGVSPDRVLEFRNWANVDEVSPLSEESCFRREWGIHQKHVAVYSGNIANKQGIEIIVAAAERLKYRKDLAFVICGNGPHRASLMSQSAGLNNVFFHDLQPRERLSDLLGLASVHLLPQIAGAADLLLPSKLTNILASGRPVVATAHLGTSLANEVQGCGLISPPGDVASFSNAIEKLLDDPELHLNTSRAARERAVQKWGRVNILREFEQSVRHLACE